jgi:serine/arginine repetitive matrix protein 1
LIFAIKLLLAKQGTSLSQDTRFSDKEKKLLKELKFGEVLSKKVDMTKVKLDIIRPWISTKMTQMMKLEDDVVEEYVINQLEEKKNPDPKMLQ